MCHENEEWCKNWWELESSIQNWHEEFDDFSWKHLKVSKICCLMGCFWPKYIMFELIKYRAIIFEWNDWGKILRKADLYLLKWHEEFGKFLPEHIWKAKIWDFYWALLSKVGNVWA